MRDIGVDGHFIEAGSVLAVGIYALHRDPALWDHQLVFDSDRFGPQNSDGRDRWQYLPFAAGPFSRIGDHFAMLEATLALSTVIRRAEICSTEADFPMIVLLTTVVARLIRAHVRARARP
jgi:cytochrome P450